MLSSKLQRELRNEEIYNKTKVMCASEGCRNAKKEIQMDNQPSKGKFPENQ